MSIPSHILDQLNSQADLVGIIGKHTTLKRAGKEFKGNCPFHGEKTPSFYVNPQKNVYNCFGCGVGGNAISFLRDYENLTFHEAVDELSRQTGIEVPKDDKKDLSYKRRPTQVANQSLSVPQSSKAPPASLNQNTPHSHSINNPVSNNATQHNDAVETHNAHNAKSDDINEYDFNSYYNDAPPPNWESNAESSYFENSVTPKQSGNSFINAAPVSEGNLYDLLININKFYQANLRINTQALSYFKQRGLTDHTIQEFGLGYAPAGWQHLEESFPQDVDGLKLLGLIRNSEKGRDYNLLRDRVIFPIRDNQGRVIGFAGRALDNDIKPKYINSSDSPVFHKQHVLYGYYEARQHRANDWLVVEGYMDVIALYQAGIYGAVASMGTSINESQISRLLQMNPTLTLCFDGDSAGQKAAWRTLEVALPVLSDDKELRFLTLPSGQDPDTYVTEHGVDAMREQIKQAMPLSQYIFAYLSERYDLGMAEGKAKLMSKVRELTNQLPKGSSFRYLLNNDIYQKLGGKNKQKTAAHDVLLDFDSDMTVSRQLELCLLFAPHLLADEPIKRLWHESGVTDIKLPQSLRQDEVPPDMRQKKYELPPLPSWQDFDSPSLNELTQVISSLLPHLPEDANAAAHFILANLPIQTQQNLAKRWQPFWSNLNNRGIIDVDELTDDLLIQLMLQALSKQLMANKNNIIIASHINRQRQTLMNWQKKQQAQQSTKLN